MEIDLQKAKEATIEAINLAQKKNIACHSYQKNSKRLIEMMSEMVKKTIFIFLSIPMTGEYFVFFIFLNSTFDM